MTYEVELKFPLPDFAPVVSQLETLQAKRGESLHQRDRYFAHPQRDFAQSDEALRLRSVEQTNCITYKGPVVDSRTKTRQEIEIPFAEGTAAAQQFAELLARLGFREVRTVEKKRTPYSLHWESRRLELAFDEVVGLGMFLEIEALADEANRHAAQDSILRLAARLGLDNSERRSYLCLLLEQDHN